MARVNCDLPNHAGEWVDIVDRITVGQYNRWRRSEYDATIEMFAELISEWNITNADGTLAPQIKATGVSALDGLDLQTIPWLVKTIQRRFTELLQIPPDDSSRSQTG